MPLNYSNRIQSCGIRPSIQRVLIYQYLCEHKIHPTADTVYTALSPEYPSLSRTTVYNTLRIFAENNLIQIIKIDDTELRYDANTEPHIHFKCTQCGRIIDIFNSTFLPVFNKQCMTSLIPPDMVVQSIQTCIWGICAECSTKTS